MRNDDRKTTTTDAGISSSRVELSLTVGGDGPILLQDHPDGRRCAWTRSRGCVATCE